VDFEAQIPRFESLEAMLQPQAFAALPESWWVVVADVVDSTRAIHKGGYRDVNAVGGSTIAAVLNAVKPEKIPFVFGGDGASFCVPPHCIESVKKALRGCQEMAQEALRLELRVGLVPNSALSCEVRISRYVPNAILTQYFFIGGGMEEADALVKQDQRYHLSGNTPSEADFSGFECRWNQVPSAQEVTFSLLVKSRLKDERESLRLYEELQRLLFEVLGEQHHHPLNLSGLSLSLNADKLKAEWASKTLGKSGIERWYRRQLIRLQNLLGMYWMRFGKTVKGVDWGRYKSDLIANSDYRKLDDMYRTVMAGDRQSVASLLVWLEQAYQQGRLFYGCHQTHSAIVTCLVFQTGVNHVHFVDASEGGYAMAAKQLKAQMQLENRSKPYRARSFERAD
jgi:hypothetical protein